MSLTKLNCLTEAMAQRLGLKAGTAVSTAAIDAHVGVPGSGVSGPGSVEKEQVSPGPRAPPWKNRNWLGTRWGVVGLEKTDLVGTREFG